MTFCKSAVVVCLVAGLISPLHSQDKSKPKMTIPLEKALLGRDLFLKYLDALGGLDRWSEIKQLLGSDRYPLWHLQSTPWACRCDHPAQLWPGARRSERESQPLEDL